MTKMKVFDKSQGLVAMEDIYASVEARLQSSTETACPVEFASGFVKLAGAQSCGKCTPCRIGLAQLNNLLDSILDGYGFDEDLDLVSELAECVYASADCAIGYEAAAVVLRSIKAFADDYHNHIEKNDCSADEFAPVPCTSGCPAEVDIPGYIALVAQGRCAEAVKLIRKDNPFSTVCGLVCEHPCEAYCRRSLMDDPINIRAIKRFANDFCNNTDASKLYGSSLDDAIILPTKAESTNKRIAIIGSGPAGLTCAYYLALMGHSPVVFEQRKRLGGMLRYGIPASRLPRQELQTEIDYLLSAGIEVNTEVTIGTDIPIKQLVEDFDAVYIAIGAHSENKLGLSGEDAAGVYSAVELLRGMGDVDAPSDDTTGNDNTTGNDDTPGSNKPDFTGKTVRVIGGGNVAMDAARTAQRLGAKHTSVIYRRRIQDMTALPAEVEMARAEGCELLELLAPVAIETTDGKVAGLTVQPQMVSEIIDGRPKPINSDAPAYTLPTDVLILAIGQAINSEAFADFGIPVKRDRIDAQNDARVPGHPKVFSGGDCVSGPSSAIMAIAAGKAAARNIDTFLGYDHQINVEVEIPAALAKGRAYCARSNMVEVIPTILAGNFDATELGFSEIEAKQEAGRCLRCDHFGLGALRGGRTISW
ncbi:MAG: FAD-dependent oxidoreductase [Coriobacteriales bacterium]|nr:FAD-dependent oxidoreductase [Coriobacteriales bacterium]